MQPGSIWRPSPCCPREVEDLDAGSQGVFGALLLAAPRDAEDLDGGGQRVLGVHQVGQVAAVVEELLVSLALPGEDGHTEGGRGRHVLLRRLVASSVDPELR